MERWRFIDAGAREAPEFFGRFYILNQTKFYIDKIANLITWQSWEDIGMGIGNIASVVKLELYAGSCSPGSGQQDTGYADVAYPDTAVPHIPPDAAYLGGSAHDTAEPDGGRKRV